MVTGKHRQGQPRSLPGKWEREVVVWPFSLVHRTRNKIKGGGKKQRQKEARELEPGEVMMHRRGLCRGHVVQ